MRTDDTRLGRLGSVISSEVLLHTSLHCRYCDRTVTSETNDLKHERGTGDWILLGTESKHPLEKEQEIHIKG